MALLSANLGLLSLALALVIIAIMALDFSAHNAQVDASLQTMADAVSALQQHVAQLSAPNNDQATLEAITARLKVGTDQLAATIAAVRAR